MVAELELNAEVDVDLPIIKCDDPNSDPSQPGSGDPPPQVPPSEPPPQVPPGGEPVEGQ